MTVALVVLRPRETVEFKKLDNLTPLDEHGDPVMTLDKTWRTPRSGVGWNFTKSTPWHGVIAAEPENATATWRSPSAK